ncbi:hypothetical protein [Paraburkholderia phytofirmans]|uniref:hypothetical protein n=1 Tax=Paraburkholderia phytofirmans TaxID=261302 RepID=UPI0011E011FD|nr:hypothetical protein [Paraburkholderia phytofirmans]
MPNGAHANWLDRMYLGALSENVALDFAVLPWAEDLNSLAQLFTDGWRIDYRYTVVRTICAACETKLKVG